MEKKIVNVPGHKQLMDEDGKPLVPISPAVIANGFVYVSGQPPSITQLANWYLVISKYKLVRCWRM